MTEPLVSVIIPVYNPGTHLVRCIDSIISQTYQYLQIILIDDGSTDSSGMICDEYSLKDNRIICIHQMNNGVSSARNAGLNLANGDYFQFPDSDDYIEPDTYEYLLRLIEKYRCDMVNFEYYVSYPDRERCHRLKEDHYGLVGTFDAHRLIMTGEPFACNKFFSKKLITANNNLPGIKFREDILRGEDSIFAHQATDRAETVWFDKRPLYHYVQSEESAVRGKFRRSQLTALKLYDAYKPLYEGKYPELLTFFLPQMAHLLIMLYYDMWADKEDYFDDQRIVFETFKNHIREVYKCRTLTKKERIKFMCFRLSPAMFCVLHKTFHHL